MGATDWGDIIQTLVLAALPFILSYIFGKSSRKKDHADATERYIDSLMKREDEIDNLRAQIDAMRANCTCGGATQQVNQADLATPKDS